MSVRIPIYCSDEIHHLVVDDDETISVDPKAHDVDLERALQALGGEKSDCFKIVDDEADLLLYSLLEPWAEKLPGMTKEELRKQRHAISLFVHMGFRCSNEEMPTELVNAMKAAGLAVRIDVIKKGCPSEARRCVDSRFLIIDGEQAEEWTRAADGAYGLSGAAGGEWGEMPAPGDDPPGGAAQQVMEEFGIKDELPCVPEPDPPDEDPEGEWKLMEHPYEGDDFEVGRYETEEDAERAAVIATRNFKAYNIGGYGYSWYVEKVPDPDADEEDE